MQTIDVSGEEVERGVFSDTHLQQAVAAIRDDGFVVLNNVVDVSHCEALLAQMQDDRKRLDAEGKVLPEGRGNQPMPREPQLLFSDVLQNRIAAHVLGAVMGREVTCGVYSSNVSLPGCGEQHLHVDQSPREADTPIGYPTNCVVMNVPLVDFTIENGATEVWPGTHMVPCEIGSNTPSEAQQAERKKVAPPERACMKRGSILLRDIRLWHRGPANHTEFFRPMAAMILNGGFRPGEDEKSTIPYSGSFPEAVRPLFEDGPIYYNCVFD